MFNAEVIVGSALLSPMTNGGGAASGIKNNMVSAPEPATQSPPVVSELERAFVIASRSVHCPSEATRLSAVVFTVIDSD